MEACWFAYELLSLRAASAVPQHAGVTADLHAGVGLQKPVQRLDDDFCPVESLGDGRTVLVKYFRVPEQPLRRGVMVELRRFRRQEPEARLDLLDQPSSSPWNGSRVSRSLCG